MPKSDDEKATRLAAMGFDMAAVRKALEVQVAIVLVIDVRSCVCSSTNYVAAVVAGMCHYAVTGLLYAIACFFSCIDCYCFYSSEHKLI
jgi:cytochrome c oxidase assembly protein Cox11